jgi:hypothetical protein
VSKLSEIEKSYSRRGPSSFKEPKSLKTSTMEESETILSVWFKLTVVPAHPPEGMALHVAAHLGTDGLQASDGWIDCFK